MAIKFEGTIFVDKMLDRICNALFGTLSSRLIFAGLGLLTFGFWDVIVFGWETKALGRDVPPPGGNMGWSEWLGFVLLVLGILMAITKNIISFLSSRADDLSERRITLLENFHDLTNARLQHELWKVYKIRNPDTVVSRLVLDHPTNQMGTMDLFKKCHLNVKNDLGNWLILKGWKFKARYHLGFITWLSFPLLCVSSLLLASLEYAAPGITSSGEFAFESFLISAFLISVGGGYLLDDLKRMGTAITLVEKYKP